VDEPTLAKRIFSVLVGIGCAYELCALPRRSPLPTITFISNTGAAHARKPFKFMAWSFGGYAAAHLVGLDRKALSGQHVRFLGWLATGYALAVAMGLTKDDGC
jgi:hypothetical protein